LKYHYLCVKMCLKVI